MASRKTPAQEAERDQHVENAIAYMQFVMADAELRGLSGADVATSLAGIVAARNATLAGKCLDPSRFDHDRFSIAWRKGRTVEKIESRLKVDTVAGANWVREVIDRDRPARVFIDLGGTGAAIYDILVDWGYGPEGKDIVRGVDLGGTPQGDAEYSDIDGKPMAGLRNR